MVFPVPSKQRARNLVLFTSLFLLTVVLLTAPSPILAQADSGEEVVPTDEEIAEWRQQVESDFVEFAGGIDRAGAARLRFQLVTVGPGVIVATAFGHSALRVIAGEEYGPRDFYVDFGEYTPSLEFLYRFLRGKQRFYVHVIPTAGAVNAWDAAARGMMVTDINLTPEQKYELIQRALTEVRDRGDGYDYDNFTNNCVTYIRDVLGAAVGQPIDLDPFDDSKVSPDIFEGAQNTWRGRELVYSNENFWLYINENLLFDPDTDLVRENGEELVFLPDDLLLALHQNGIAGETRVIVPHRHNHHPLLYHRFLRIFDAEFLAAFFPPGLNQFGNATYSSKRFLSAVMIAILAVCLPLAFLDRYRIWGERAYAVIFGMAGIWATLIRFGTFFHFMDGTLTPLIFFPLDILLFRNAAKTKDPAAWRKLQFGYGLFRVGLILVAMVLITFVWPQSVLDLAGFALVFFAFYTYNHRPRAQAAAATEAA